MRTPGGNALSQGELSRGKPRSIECFENLKTEKFVAEIQRVMATQRRTASGLTTFSGVPAAKALIWSKTVVNCSSHSSTVT